MRRGYDAAVAAQDRALRALDRFLALLGQELAPGDIEVGWSEALKREWATWLEEYRASTARGEITNSLALDRALCDTLVGCVTDPALTPLSAAGYEALAAIEEWCESGGPERGQHST